MLYCASRGGHAPSWLRGLFVDWVGADMRGPIHDELHGVDRTARWITGQLWNCTDVMPSGLCGDLDLPRGSTYARGARRANEMRWWPLTTLGRRRPRWARS